MARKEKEARKMPRMELAAAVSAGEETMCRQEKGMGRYLRCAMEERH